MLSILISCCALAASADAPFPTFVAAPAAVSELPATTGTPLTQDELAKLAAGQPVTPMAELTCGVRAADGALWVGSPGGLMLLTPQAQRWRLFHSRRWLPDDRVERIAVTKDGEVFVQTPGGIGTLRVERITLEKKMDEIDALLQKYHVRDGFVCHARLKEHGKIESAEIEESNDNDGLWTSMYVAAEAFRYAVTQDPQAKKNARRSLEALMFLERISGIPGFAARSVIPIDRDPKRHGGEWHRSADNRWWWKGDTSSDEVVGHYFAYSIYYDVAADENEKKEIAEYVARITDHILDNGLYYIGPPGVPTTWGIWAPEKLNHDLRRFGDRGLNSLEILSHLKVAEHIVGKPRYTAKLKELIEKDAYAINTVGQKQIWPPRFINHSDDELAFLSYYPLVIYERDPRLREIYLASIHRSWAIERPERSPLWNFIYGAALQAEQWTDARKRPDKAYVAGTEYDLAESLEWLRDVPSDTIHWTVKNSHRRDVPIDGENRFRRAKSKTVPPVSERHVMRWNGDPYTLDGGSDGRSRDDGTPLLLPYWMGRYHRFLD